MKSGNWVVRITWKTAEGIVHPENTYFNADSETHAVDEAVSTLNNNRHPRAMVQAVGAAIRREGDEGPWRGIGS